MVFAIREASRSLGAPITLYRFRGVGNPPVGPFGFHNGDVGRLVLTGASGGAETYEPWPVKNTPISWTGSMDKADTTVSLAMGSPLDEVFSAYPPSQVVNLTMREGHMGDEPTAPNHPVVWIGRVASWGFEGHELNLACLPISSVLGRAGLQRAWQIGCPHALYGPECRASKSAARSVRAVASIEAGTMGLAAPIDTPRRLAGGMIEWVRDDSGLREMRTIVRAIDGDTLQIRGTLPGIAAGQDVSIYYGCNHQMSDCALHNNILNFGGQPLIPLENPLSDNNQFY